MVEKLGRSGEWFDGADSLHSATHGASLGDTERVRRHGVYARRHARQFRLPGNHDVHRPLPPVADLAHLQISAASAVARVDLRAVPNLHFAGPLVRLFELRPLHRFVLSSVSFERSIPPLSWRI